MKIKKIDLFFTPGKPRLKEVRVDNVESLGSASLGTEIDSDNDNETGYVLPLKGPGF